MAEVGSHFPGADGEAGDGATGEECVVGDVVYGHKDLLHKLAHIERYIHI